MVTRPGRVPSMRASNHSSVSGTGGQVVLFGADI